LIQKAWHLDTIIANAQHVTDFTRSLIESALEEAWQELSKDSELEAARVQRRLRRTIVALASVGETDPKKLKWFAIHAWRGAIQAEQAAMRARMSGMAA
jgi:hypothetical protein